MIVTARTDKRGTDRLGNRDALTRERPLVGIEKPAGFRLLPWSGTGSQPASRLLNIHKGFCYVKIWLDILFARTG